MSREEEIKEYEGREEAEKSDCGGECDAREEFRRTKEIE